MRRYLIFLLYDPEGYVDDAVLHTLRGFRPQVERILVVSNGYLQEESARRLEGVADEVLERENIGFDIGAYRAALGHVGRQNLDNYDEVLLVNYTFFGPIDSFNELFERMDANPADFWGMSDHIAMTPHPILGVGTMPQHLQSYWLALRARLFQSDDFWNYWAELENANSYHDVIVKFETQFTEHFAQLGYKWAVAYSHEEYGTLNASMEAPMAMLADGCPIFKRRIFFHDAVDRDHAGVAAAEVAKFAIDHGYPRDVLIDGIIRRTSARQLSAALDSYLMIEPETPTPETDADEHLHSGDFWVAWLRDGIDPFAGRPYLICSGEPLPKSTSSATMRAARQRGLDVTVHATQQLRDAFDADAQLGVVVPLVEHRSTEALGRGYGDVRTDAFELAKILQLRMPLEPDAPLTPVHGIMVVRQAAVSQLPDMVKRAGGWKALAAQFGGDQQLAHLLDLLIADIARTHGFLTAQATTPFQLRVSHAMLEQKYSRAASRFEPGPKSPFFGRLVDNSLRSNIARWVRARSPEAAGRIGAVERKLKAAIAGVRGTLGKGSDKK